MKSVNIPKAYETITPLNTLSGQMYARCVKYKKQLLMCKCRKTDATCHTPHFKIQFLFLFITVYNNFLKESVVQLLLWVNIKALIGTFIFDLN